MKRKWIAHPYVYIWFWEKQVEDRMLDKTLKDDNELIQWCLDNSCKVEDAWVECNNEQNYLLFALRWA
jgi:hypothetical protein